MNWDCEFSKDAETDLKSLPKPIQKRVARILVEMGIDPFQGDVKALHGEEWKGVFRKRIGDYGYCLPWTARETSSTLRAYSCAPGRRIAEGYSAGAPKAHIHRDRIEFKNFEIA